MLTPMNSQWMTQHLTFVGVPRSDSVHFRRSFSSYTPCGPRPRQGGFCGHTGIVDPHEIDFRIIIEEENQMDLCCRGRATTPASEIA